MASNCNILKECKICHENYVDPHMLECGHSFCKKCIDAITLASDEKRYTKCPLCNESSSSSKRNYAMLELLEAISKMQKLDRIRVRAVRRLEVNSNLMTTSLQLIGNKQWKVTKSIKLEDLTNNVRLMDTKLWTCHAGGCTVFTLDLQALHKVTFSDVGMDNRHPVTLDRKYFKNVVYDIAREGKNTLIIASKDGIWRAFDNGNLLKCLNKEAHTGIYVSSSLVFYISKNNISMTNLSRETIKYDENLFSAADIAETRYGDRVLTVARVGSELLVSNGPKCTITCFSVDCEMVNPEQTTESSLFGINSCYSFIKYGTKLYTDTFEVDSPFICCSDDDGNVLIADCGNDRLLLRQCNMEYKELDLQPPVIAPNCAVYYDGKLFVLSWHHQKLYRYECAADK